MAVASREFLVAAELLPFPDEPVSVFDNLLSIKVIFCREPATVHLPGCAGRTDSCRV